MGTQGVSAVREVPMYEGMPDTVWYHFLHGNVPGHEIDFIYQPSVPQGALTRQHFSHLARIVKYIEPRYGSAYAFAIANLSRDDTQYEPGRGGVAIVFGLRIKGATDHAGRQDPPFCHSIVCVDRHLDEASAYEAAITFYNKLLPDQPSRLEGSGWYHTYLSTAQQQPESLLGVIRGYIQNFDDLPTPGPSALGLRWTVETSTPPKRIVIVYPDEAPFEVLAHCVVRILSVLVESDIRWSAISNGREQDVFGGTTVRLVPEREAVQEPDDVVLMHIDQVPKEARDIAGQLFGAEEVPISQVPELRLNWRHMMANEGRVNTATRMPSPSSIASAGKGSIRPPAMGSEERVRPWAKPDADTPTPPATAENAEGLEPAQVNPNVDAQPESMSKPSMPPEAKRKQRRSIMPIVGLGLFVAVAGLLVAVWFGMNPTLVNGPARGQPSMTVPTEAPAPIVSAAPAVTAAPVIAPSAPLTEPTAETSAAPVASAEPALETSAAPETATSRPAPSAGQKPTTKKTGTTKTDEKIGTKNESPIGAALPL